MTKYLVIRLVQQDAIIEGDKLTFNVDINGNLYFHNGNVFVKRFNNFDWVAVNRMTEND